MAQLSAAQRMRLLEAHASAVVVDPNVDLRLGCGRFGCSAASWMQLREGNQ